MWGNVVANFVDAGLQFSNISLSRDTKYIESYGHSPGIRKIFCCPRISLLQISTVAEE